MRIVLVMIVLALSLLFGCTSEPPAGQRFMKEYNDDRTGTTVAYVVDNGTMGTVARPIPGGSRIEEVNLSEFYSFIEDYNSTCSGCVREKRKPLRAYCPEC
jgi:hypothetical protein